MKNNTHFSILLILLTCTLLFACFNSSLQNGNDILDDVSVVGHRTQVTFCPRGCCMNMLLVDETAVFPTTCDLPYSLYAINLDDLNISQDYSCGDTLNIVFNFTEDCEAQGTGYNCVYECDLRHGIPIDIIAVE